MLERRITENGMPLEAYTPYLDLRRYGSVPHSGARVCGCACLLAGG